MSHDLFHRASWRACRLGALIIGTPVALVLVAGVSLLWRLSLGPLEVTSLVAHLAPVTIQAGDRPDHPAGRLIWGRLFLSWQPGLRHVHPELGLEAENLRILRQDGSSTLGFDHVSIGVRMGPLLRGHIEPTRVSAQGGRVILDRHADGSVDLDWPNARYGAHGSSPLSLIHLASVDLSSVNVLLRHALPQADDSGRDTAHDMALTVRHAALRHPPYTSDFAWSGMVRGEIGLRSRPAIHFHLSGDRLTHAVSWQLGLAPFTPDILAGLTPSVAAWHVPVGLQASFALSLEEGKHKKSELPVPLTDGQVVLTLGKGTIDQQGGDKILVDSGQVSARVAMPDHGLTINEARAEISLVDDIGNVTRFAAHGDLQSDSLLAAQYINAGLAVTASPLNIPHLASIWPHFLMKGARRWVTYNLTTGVTDELKLEAVLGSENGWRHLLPRQAKASLNIDHATVHWLRPVPPAHNVAARFSFASPDTLKIEFLHGTQPASETGKGETIHLDGGSMLISQLFGRDQMGTINLDLSGDLSSSLRLLAHPRLHLLSRHPLPFTHPSGNVRIAGVISLPLSSHIENDQIHVDAKARFNHVALGNVVLGREITEASGTLRATETHMSLSGHGWLDGVPTDATLQENFLNQRGKLRETIHAVSLFDETSVKRALLIGDGLFHGTAELVADYRAVFDGNADLKLSLDLTSSALSLPVWHKATGLPATVSAHIGLRGGRMIRLDRIAAKGPALHVEGAGTIDDGQVRAITLDGFSIGRSTGDAVIKLPDPQSAAVNVRIHAQDLDMGNLFQFDDKKARHDTSQKSLSGGGILPGHQTKGAQYGGGSMQALDWTVDIATDRLFYSQDKFFGGVTAHLEHRRQRLDRARFKIVKPVGVLFELSPYQEGRHLELRIDNLGQFLHETGITERLEGGRAHVEGHVDDGGRGRIPPFKGVISVTPFTFRQPPAVLTTATHLSVFNWSQASHDRFEVAHLHFPVKVNDDVMSIDDGHLGNPALGATLEGQIGLDKGSLDLRGTVVPVFGINAAPGRLPNVGKLFSPEKGGGLLAATFTVKGTASNPDLSVNPFAMLLPGVMRQLVK